MKKLLLLPLLLLMVACSDDDDNNPVSAPINSPITNLKINEVVAKGSDFENEFGNTDDWVEIYNPTAETITLPANYTYFSDNISSPEKYKLPNDLTIEPNGYLIICCDDSNRVLTLVHTNFKLSATGEEFCIYYNDGNVNGIIDKIAFPGQDGSQSYGRYPDGGEEWGWLIPTPESTNLK